MTNNNPTNTRTKITRSIRKKELALATVKMRIPQLEKKIPKLNEELSKLYEKRSSLPMKPRGRPEGAVGVPSKQTLKWVKLREKGLNLQQIADKYGCTRQNVHQVLQVYTKNQSL